MKYISKNMYFHLIDKNDIEKESAENQNDQQVDQILSYSKQKGVANEVDYLLIEYEESRGKYTLLESIIIISAYCASRNNESQDNNFFGKPEPGKKRRTATENHTSRVGKTKRFSLDRLLVIIDYFINQYAPKCSENQNLNHSTSIYAKINTLAKDKLLKKSLMKIEDPSSTVFRVNFDEAFALEVSKNIPNLEISNYAITHDN